MVDDHDGLDFMWAFLDANKNQFLMQANTH